MHDHDDLLGFRSVPPRETPFYASKEFTIAVFAVSLAVLGPLQTLYNFVVAALTAVVSMGSLWVMFMWAPTFAPWFGGLGLFLIVIVPTILGTCTAVGGNRLGDIIFRNR